jgi:hypothetical protein
VAFGRANGPRPERGETAVPSVFEKEMTPAWMARVGPSNAGAARRPLLRVGVVSYLYTTPTRFTSVWEKTSDR